MSKATERRVTNEAMKAETAILRMRRAIAKSRRENETRWAQKLRALYNGFPPAVTAVLLAGGVIKDADLEPESVPEEAPPDKATA